MTTADVDLHALLPVVTAVVRHVAGDPALSVGIGPFSAYSARTHRVMFAARDLAPLSPPARLALAAHEAAHARISRAQLAALPAEIAFDPDEMALLNWFEDGRVNGWIAHHFPGLEAGAAELDRSAVASFDRPVARSIAFMVTLRARVHELPGTSDDPDVEAAVRRCLPAARAAIFAFPQRWDADEATTTADALAALALFLDPILPAYRALREAASRPVVQPAPRAPSTPPRGSWRGPRPTTVGRAGAVARAAPGPTDVAPPADVVARFLSALDRLFAQNEGDDRPPPAATGARLDLRAAMRATMRGEPSVAVFERSPEASRRAWRVVVIADTSASMRGPRRDALRHVLDLVLRGADAVGIPTAVLWTGRGRGTAGGQVELAKAFRDPVGPFRSRLAASLRTLGDETPTAQALRRAAEVLGDEAGDEDVVLVITDGRPEWTEPRHFDQPAQIGQRGEDGTRGPARPVRGTVSVWIAEERSVAETAAACARLIARPRTTVFAAGIGEEAGVERWCPTGARYAGSRDFVERLPGDLARVLEATAEGRGP